MRERAPDRKVAVLAKVRQQALGWKVSYSSPDMRQSGPWGSPLWDVSCNTSTVLVT